ncbi:glycosyltransferase family 9 protein [Ignavibacteria bacterium]|nr:glycosyltransferase family 9 protein [Bacteroidota bacterium]MCZ2132474.1 glycosyltransferase family 9 protein [Bacteroidota bacterium]
MTSPQNISKTAATPHIIPRSILVFALSGIGDALMASPALCALRNKFPDARIELLTMFRPVAEIYRENTAIDNVLFWNFLKENPLASLKFILSLRKKRYDVSFMIFPANRWPYNVISRLAGAKTRLGHDYLHVNTRSLNILNNARITEDDDLHNVEENLRLAGLLGALVPDDPVLEISVPQPAQATASTWLAEHDIDSNTFIVGMHAGSATFKNQINKRWSAKGYADIVRRLSKERDARILLFGGPDEEELNRYIADMAGGAAIVAQTPNFLMATALMQRCKLFISNDSGLMHVAAALDLPTVAIFGYTSHIHTRPWCKRAIVVRHDLPCSPCFYFSPRPASCKWTGDDEFMCIRRISSDEVYEACAALLD